MISSRDARQVRLFGRTDWEARNLPQGSESQLSPRKSTGEAGELGETAERPRGDNGETTGSAAGADGPTRSSDLGEHGAGGHRVGVGKEAGAGMDRQDQVDRQNRMDRAHDPDDDSDEEFGEEREGAGEDALSESQLRQRKSSELSDSQKEAPGAGEAPENDERDDALPPEDGQAKSGGIDRKDLAPEDPLAGLESEGGDATQERHPTPEILNPEP